MKRFFMYVAILALVSAPAFAAKNSEKLTLTSPVTVGTTQLPAADYKVTWTTNGSNAEVTLVNGKSAFTLPAKVVDQKNNLRSVLTRDENGTKVLQNINFSNVTLVFTSHPSSGQ